MDVQARLNPTDLFSAKGLVVVITGGGSGIGLAIASALYQTGAAHIYLLGRRLDILQDAIKTLESSPSAPNTSSTVLTAISADVTDQSTIDAAVEQITKEVGYVDVLINNAGIIGPANGQDLRKAESIDQLKDAFLKDYDKWHSTLAINTQSVIGVSGAFLPLLNAANTRRGWAPGKVTGDGNPRVQDASALSKAGLDADDDRMAQIITVASVASFMRVAFSGLAYSASKSAAMHLGKMLSTILAEWGIRSNVVCPGPFPSDMTSKVHPKFGTAQVPQGRMGGVGDVAGVLLFLVGKGGAYVNGSAQLMDGGRLGVFPTTY
ncbi:NAD(P)-binding protein [Lentithecium fluviatile CBS 122367]|uniref:NAD(P)-binding protein n=1 Tax=Lentithecium fluviatile CBS 122367 TaxID=1168545 RepID=A0A6G1J7X8_9PLEO|nr:NAD(P)-binding protein [Lentithecium fluviatile CBS 122367]